LLIAPIVFSTCTTTKSVNSEIETTLAAIKPPVPQAPELEPVVFEDRDGGLWLSYQDYRALERNVIALREYAGRLEVVIEFYTEGD
jgi:hypothetical protein